MEQRLLTYLRTTGRRVLGQQVRFALVLLVLTLSLWFLGYGLCVLFFRGVSLTLPGLLLLPGLSVTALLVAVPWLYLRLRNPRAVARLVEARNPRLQLALRSCLDFMDGRSDQEDTPLKAIYIEQVLERLADADMRVVYRYPWGRYAFTALWLSLALWVSYGGRMFDKFYNPTSSFGQTHLDLQEGSITVFEPEYTQIPGRTLPLKPGAFSAFPGAKVRFLVHLPEDVQTLYLAQEGREGAPADKPIPLRISEERTIAHEFVLLEPTNLQFLLAEDDTTGRTAPFKFTLKTDAPPEVQLRSYTPEGPINEMDPLIVEVEVKDDFGVQELEAVVQWEGGEKRLPIKVPPARRNHFLAKRQWYLSDLDLGDADSFTLYFEAHDNNPINGPGIGKSATLSYELESPDKKYQAFMKEAKELLDTMAGVLGDNLETDLPDQMDQATLDDAELMGKRISQGLYQGLTLTNNLISLVRETPNLSRLDQTFLHQFRNGISAQARARSDIGLYYKNMDLRLHHFDYRELLRRHRGEELGVEGLTYDLLLQLKMWAVFELERRNNELKNDLENLEDLLNQAENMDSQELMDMFNKLMDEVMKNFQEMMAAAAAEMDMNMTEFMNAEAMQDQTDKMQELREQIMQALKDGDMNKARALMEELKAQMEGAFQGMQQQMGEMSPEMQAMMANMRELMGLLRELKGGEEGLETATRDLKTELDRQMGGNDAQMDPAQREAGRKATERIHKMLEDLYNKLVEYRADEISEELVAQIAEYRAQLDAPDLNPQDRAAVQQKIAEQERLLDFLTRDGLDKLQEITLKNLSQTEKMQEYLDQGELTLTLESGMKLDGSLVNGERVAERTAGRRLRDEARPKETFGEARKELYQILQELMRVKKEAESDRARHMKAQGEERQMDLAQRQDQLQQMIEEFMQRTEESFGDSQVEEKLKDIANSMKNAENRLRDARLESGIQHEQEALQKIGEMMEQLQQSSRPNGRPSQMRYGKRTGQQGDPSLEDIFIPESEKKAARDQMKDAIRERLEKNLPEAYGKEIRKYYEKLMDQ